MVEDHKHSALTEEEKKFLDAISIPEKRHAAIRILEAAGLLGASSRGHSSRRQA